MPSSTIRAVEGWVSDYSDVGSMSQVNPDDPTDRPGLPDTGQIHGRKRRDQRDVIGAIDVLWFGV